MGSLEEDLIWWKEERRAWFYQHVNKTNAQNCLPIDSEENKLALVDNNQTLGSDKEAAENIRVVETRNEIYKRFHAR